MNDALKQIDVNTLTSQERKDLYDLARQAAIIDIEILKDSYVLSTQAAKDFALAKYRCFEREVFGVFFMNSAHQVIAVEEIFFGTIDAASIHPREVVKLVVQHNAAAVLLFHNHPSWNNHPSPSDVAITKKLINVLEMINVKVLDHIIVGGSSCSSFVELGLI